LLTIFLTILATPVHLYRPFRQKYTMVKSTVGTFGAYF
jgi:hypothetical protein